MTELKMCPRNRAFTINNGLESQIIALVKWSNYRDFFLGLFNDAESLFIISLCASNAQGHEKDGFHTIMSGVQKSIWSVLILTSLLMNTSLFSPSNCWPIAEVKNRSGHQNQWRPVPQTSYQKLSAGRACILYPDGMYYYLYQICGQCN